MDGVVAVQLRVANLGAALRARRAAKFTRHPNRRRRIPVSADSTCTEIVKAVLDCWPQAPLAGRACVIQARQPVAPVLSREREVLPPRAVVHPRDRSRVYMWRRRR